MTHAKDFCSSKITKLESLYAMTIVKICGIKTLSEARAALEAGADYLGFNFFPKSVRFIEVREFAAIASIMKKEKPSIKLVGVFVNSPADEIRSLLETGALDLAQLHGDESPEFCAAFGNKAFKAYRRLPDAGAKVYFRNEAPALLVDANVSGSYGGTGLTADWPAAAGLAKRYPLFLAGGLNPDNVAEAVKQVNPWGVDVASGVESTPGKKDMGKMISFVQAVRSCLPTAPT
jgi:phosphoribosylanthranilate isomerase